MYSRRFEICERGGLSFTYKSQQLCDFKWYITMKKCIVNTVILKYGINGENNEPPDLAT